MPNLQQILASWMVFILIFLKKNCFNFGNAPCSKNAENSEFGRQNQIIKATVTLLLLPTDYMHIIYIGRIYTILRDIQKSYVIWGK